MRISDWSSDVCSSDLLLGGGQRMADRDRIADERDVLAGTGDACLADRHDVIVELRHLEAAAVENLVLQHQHRVGIADRRLDQALEVGRAVGCHHLQAGDMRSEEHTSELQSLMRTSYDVFCLKKTR